MKFYSAWLYILAYLLKYIYQLNIDNYSSMPVYTAYKYLFSCCSCCYTKHKIVYWPLLFPLWAYHYLGPPAWCHLQTWCTCTPSFHPGHSQMVQVHIPYVTQIYIMTHDSLRLTRQTVLSRASVHNWDCSILTWILQAYGGSQYWKPCYSLGKLFSPCPQIQSLSQKAVTLIKNNSHLVNPCWLFPLSPLSVCK